VIWLKFLLAFLALAGYGCVCVLLGYFYRGLRTAALGTVEKSPWAEYHSDKTPVTKPNSQRRVTP
jgi:hypothetical protein